MNKWTALAVCAVAAAVGIFAIGARQDAAGARSAGSELVFDKFSRLSGSSFTYVVRSNGSVLRRLPLRGGSAAWSPDHRSIAYEPEFDVTIFVIDADTAKQRRINVRDDEFDGNPRWSPDAKRIVYDQDDGIAITTVAKGGHRDVPLPFRAEEPDWSPKGNRLAFSQALVGEIYVARTDGTGVRQITRNGPLEYDSGVRWSPSGRSLLFIRHGPGADWALYTVPAAGGKPKKLVTGSFIASAAWSPDGEQIAYLLDGREFGTWSQNRIHIFDVRRGQDVRVLDRDFCFDVDPAVSCRTIDW